ncbi:MAG TPA: hypothetical protein P5114_09040 [Hyphomicrobiaceae bacterium]|nr:hypothetical protein [Hyphomicrobiaceae bacterium]
MSNMQNLKRKYSWGQVPQWEIDALEAANAPAKDKKPAKRAKSDDGDGNGNLDTGA